MACEAKLQLTGGESIYIALPSINSYNEASSNNNLIREVASIIASNPDLKEQVADLISKSKAKKNRYHVTSFDEDSGLPIGNTNISEIVNKYNNDEITAYREGLRNLGVDISDQNILLLNTEFYTNFINKGGIFKRDNYSVVILEDNVDTVKGYLKYLYITNWLSKNSDSWMAKDIETKTNNLFNKLDEKYKDHSRSFMSCSLTLIEQNGIGQEFWKFLLLSPKFRDEVTSFQEGKELIRLLNGLINPKAMLPRTEYNYEEVNEFMSKIKEDIISRKDINEFMSKYNFESEEDLLYYLNGRDANLEIVVNNGNGVLFRCLDSVKPSKEEMDVNTSELDYTGELVSRVYYSEPYSIYSYNGMFYVTDRYAATSLDLVTIKDPFETFDQAKNNITSKTKTDKINFKSYRTLFKWGKPITTLVEGNTFQALDVEIDPKTELLEDDIKLFSELKRAVGVKQARFIQEFTRIKPYNNSKYSILNTIEKIETFFLLKAQEFNKIEYDKLDTKAKKEYISKLEDNILNKINSLEIATFTVTGLKENGDCIIEKVNHPENHFGDNSSFTPRDNTQQIIDVSDRISRLLGIKVNLINSSELDRFPWLKGNEKAFIYNGEIYVNLSLANPSDVLHEYGHLILGTIKQRNHQLYNVLISKVEESPEFGAKLQELKTLYGEHRSQEDLQEEIFVEMFAQKADLDTEKKVKSTIKTIFGLKSSLDATSLAELESMTLNDLLLTFGSIVLKEPKLVFNSGLSTTSRVMSNIIEQLMTSGNLKENCNG